MFDTSIVDGMIAPMEVTLTSGAVVVAVVDEKSPMHAPVSTYTTRRRRKPSIFVLFVRRLWLTLINHG